MTDVFRFVVNAGGGSTLSRCSLHLLLVHTSQIMVVGLNYEAHTTGILMDVEYKWSWYFGDIFHAGVGMALTLLLLVSGVLVTETCKYVSSESVDIAAGKGIRATRRATLASLLEGQLTGYRVAGFAVTMEFLVLFCWAEFLNLYGHVATSLLQY